MRKAILQINVEKEQISVRTVGIKDIWLKIVQIKREI